MPHQYQGPYLYVEGEQRHGESYITYRHGANLVTRVVRHGEDHNYRIGIHTPQGRQIEVLYEPGQKATRIISIEMPGAYKRLIEAFGRQLRPRLS